MKQLSPLVPLPRPDKESAPGLAVATLGHWTALQQRFAFSHALTPHPTAAKVSCLHGRLRRAEMGNYWLGNFLAPN